MTAVAPERAIELAGYARATRRQTRVAQGLPPDLTDPGQLERLADLFDTQPTAEAS